MTERQRFFAGLAAGIFILAVCIEAVRAIAERGWVGTFDGVLWWLGRFRWLYDYQTFLTGAAAVAAATFSIRAVRDQIKASDKAVQRQIDHAKQLEADRRDAKRAAARATLPLALSAINDYARECIQSLLTVLDACQPGRVLPKTVILPTFPSVPSEGISALKEMVEFSEPPERKFISLFLTSIQVQRTRILGLIEGHQNPHHIISELNIKRYIVDALEIYSQAEGLYGFGRGKIQRIPDGITYEQIGQSLGKVGIYDDLAEELTDLYGLTGQKKWAPPFAA